MFKLTSFFIAVLFLFSCQQPTERQQIYTATDTTVMDTVAIVNDPYSNVNVHTNSFTQIGNSEIIMFPLSLAGTLRESSSLEYSRPYGNTASGYWNIIFYNTKTSAYHLLSERKMLVNNYDLKTRSNDDADTDKPSQSIFYSVIVDDFNGDKKLTPDDPKYLFVSDREGNNFRQVSPAHCTLNSWAFIYATNKIIMTVTKDTDHNKEFGDKDEVTTFQIDIDKENAPHEIFSTQFKTKLKLVYEKNWNQK